jgi:hypothetical protein
LLFSNDESPEGRLVSDAIGMRAGAEIYSLRDRVLAEGRVLSGVELPVEATDGRVVYTSTSPISRCRTSRGRRRAF